MTTEKLTKRAQELLIGWFAAGYSEEEISRRAAQHGLANLDGEALSGYRQQLTPEIEAAERERRDRTMNTGLVRREERLARLIRHAEEMEARRLGEDGLKYAREWR